MKKKNFSIVIAVDDKNGIGKNGTLAWRIKEDMDFFRTLTLTSKKSHRQNAVIMGRKTWESIPEKFRPLPGRINCILSSSYSENPTIINPTTFGFSDFEDCHVFLSKRVDIENIFIIGGSFLYNMVLDTPCLEKIYLTRVYGDFNCDTFFSPIPERFSIVESGERKETQGLQYQMFVYKNTEKKHFSLSSLSRKHMFLGGAVLLVVLLLLSISFLFGEKESQEKTTSIQEENISEGIPPVQDVPQDTPILEIPQEEETPDIVEEVMVEEENTSQEEDKNEQIIEGPGYSISYPLDTPVQKDIMNFIETKKLEYKIQNFNAKNAGNEINWKIDYQLTDTDVIFTETRSGKKIGETKIPLK